MSNKTQHSPFGRRDANPLRGSSPVCAVLAYDYEKMKSSPDPEFSTKAEHLEVMEELKKREPLFHREEFGSTCEDYEKMTESNYWEIVASGRRYCREYVVVILPHRFKNLTRATWFIEDFQSQKIADKNYLVTYTLFQGERKTRRSTIWRFSENNWKVMYHQGTIVE